jgi:serine/threonine protein kinase
MNALIRKAAAKKQKFKKFLDKVEKYEEDSDGSISSDDIDSLEEDYIGEILNNDYLILKYVGRGTFSRVWLAHHIPSKTEKVIKMYFSDDKDEFTIKT